MEQFKNLFSVIKREIDKIQQTRPVNVFIISGFGINPVAEKHLVSLDQFVDKRSYPYDLMISSATAQQIKPIVNTDFNVILNALKRSEYFHVYGNDDYNALYLKTMKLFAEGRIGPIYMMIKNGFGFKAVKDKIVKINARYNYPGG